ncbi:hypothetical protein Ga0100231_011875 [Opitutaceae bacterium TAV4]|nr:hypothetical protein Ga0100231_011875 [Opitutaceae bacterium TAV4]RRJ98918.1 hypothetical protein Ga0100230_011495 [Opitutaceae bacterium TAV3]
MANDATPTMPPGHKKILNERLAAYQSGKSQPVTHDEMMRRLRSR